MSTPEHCDDDGKGGCVKHPPTLRLDVNEHTCSWLVDEHCPGRRCRWPALPEAVNWSEWDHVQNHRNYIAGRGSRESMAGAYIALINPALRTQGLIRTLRRIRAAETLRAKGKVTPGVTFKG